MSDPAYQRRFQRQAEANPQALYGYTEQRLGVPPHIAVQFLQIHRDLTEGKKVTPAQTRQLMAGNPTVDPRMVSDLVHRLNQQPPHTRADLYLAILANDPAAYNGSYAESGPLLKELQAFTKTYHTETMAAEINARREERADPELLAKVIERPQHDPLSTRALIEAQIDGDVGKRARYVADLIEQGDPNASVVLADNLANRAESAMERLQPEAEGSTRDSVAAAYDFHEVEAIAEDQGLVSKEDA